MADTFRSVHLNTTAVQDRTYDAIVIGSGISGGWAAKELCEKGLKTLVLERGRNVEHIKDYTTAMTPPWGLPHRNRLTYEMEAANPIASKCYAFEESTHQFFVKDEEHPYVQVKPFDWIRGYQVGGKSLMWARMTQRWSNHDFEANARDGFGVDWPIRYDDIAPWYSYVERFVGISGNKDGLPQLPDGEFLPPFVGLLSAADEALLDEVGETILPTTPDSPGAKAAKIGLFINVMVTDCYSLEEQQVFQAGLLTLNAATQAQYGQDFPALSADQRHAFLLTLEAEVKAAHALRVREDPEAHYYSMIKQLTMFGYFSSEVGATQALRYVPVPGRYDPCLPYEEGQKAWA